MDLKQPTRGRTSSPMPLFGLASGGVCIALPVTRKPVVSYTAFSPFPKARPRPAFGSCFLLHFPVSRLNLTLSGALLCEARTFLSRTLSRIRQRPPAALGREWILRVSSPFVKQLISRSRVSAPKDDILPGFRQEMPRQNTRQIMPRQVIRQDDAAATIRQDDAAKVSGKMLHPTSRQLPPINSRRMEFWGTLSGLMGRT